MVSPDDLKQAATRIAPYIHRTPVMSSEMLDALAGASIYFKCENLQKAGAFKSRGAVNAVFSLLDSAIAKGVATHSSGNHGAALARAARLRGVPAYIVVPENAKASKKAAITAYGGQVITCESTLAAREARLSQVVSETGATFVPPYDDDAVIAGQGTCALEFLEQVPGLDCMVVPVGGGGLLAGSAIACSGTGVEVFGAEPAMADDAYRSFHAGERISHHEPKTIADGLQTTLGARNFQIIQKSVTDIVLVSEEQIIEAMRLLWTMLKLVVEASAAVAFAAILAEPNRFNNKNVGAILTGGNVDLDALPFSIG